MPDLDRDPVKVAAQLRQWADDETITGVAMNKGDLIRLADMLDPIKAAPPKAKPKPAPDAQQGCNVCGGKIPDEPCGFGQCPVLLDADHAQ